LCLVPTREACLTCLFLKHLVACLLRSIMLGLVRKPHTLHRRTPLAPMGYLHVAPDNKQPHDTTTTHCTTRGRGAPSGSRLGTTYINFGAAIVNPAAKAFAFRAMAAGQISTTDTESV